MLLVGCRQDALKPVQPAASTESIYYDIDRQFIGGNLLVAQRLAEDAEQRYRTVDPLWAARFRIALARVYLFEGRSDDITTLLRQPLPSNLEDEQIIRQNLLLAVAEGRLGHATLARKAIDRAKSLHPQGAMRAEVSWFEGIRSLDQGNALAAEPLFEDALTEARRRGAKHLEMSMWSNLGVVALQLNHDDDALERFTHASVLAQSLGDRQAIEDSLGNLGWVYYRTGDFARALQNSNAAEAAAKAIGANLARIQWLRNAGMSQFQTNDLTAAHSSFERALSLAESLNNDEMTYQVHLSLAYLLLRLRSPEAELHVREAVRLGSLREDDRTEASLPEALLLIQKGFPDKAETKLLVLVRQATAMPVIQWEAENTLATLYDANGRSHDADRWFQRGIATFHQQRLSLQSIELELPFLENGGGLYLGYMEHLIREGKTDAALQILDSSRAETLAEGLGTPTAASSKLQAQFTSVRSLAARLNATILVYCLRPQASYLWAISPTRTEFHTLPGSQAILPLVERHTQAILASKDLLTQKDSTGRQLYDALVRPAEGVLSPDGRVFLIADKGLGGLNFDTLIPPTAGPASPHYWIEDVAITNARSLRLLAAANQTAANQTAPKPAPTATRRLLLIGDPVYRTGEFPPLANAAAEMTGVQSHFPPEQRAISAGASASPTTYVSDDPGSFAYIHFVAHATANDTNPLDSAIILSDPPNTPADRPEANRLYARDILARPLHAELVTISSCYGSGTRNYSGEGVVGLVWAFLRAGAHSVIGAMWEVSDVSTPRLMDALYGRLLSGDKPDQALRSAKLAMLHGDGIFRKPLYWASFQLYAGR